MAKKETFLTVIAREHNSGEADSDRYGGAAGANGSGLPTTSLGTFMFATGIECSYPTIGQGRIRRDLLDECGHYVHWRKDLQLVHALGLKVLRYGLPYHRMHLGIGQYDWSFADEVMQEIKRLHITPIVDLLHFGLPDWLGNFQNPEFPVRFAAYAGAVARRYPWVRFYTPVNEIYVCAKFSGKEGKWNEQLTSDNGFVTALKHLVAANTLACHAIARQRPDAVIVQSESAEYVHEVKAEKSADIALNNQLRFLALDLLYAHAPDANVMCYLLDNGMTREEYAWNMRGEPPGYQVMGNDYYGRNETMLLPDGSSASCEDVLGWYQITLQYYHRYKKPVMHTETNNFNATTAPNWLWKQWVNVLRMRADGVPVLGFTWYSLIDQIDWDVALAQKHGTVNACGLYDMNRNPRPVAAAYRQLLEEFGQIAILPHGDIFQMTSRQSVLKTAV